MYRYIGVVVGCALSKNAVELAVLALRPNQYVMLHRRQKRYARRGYVCNRCLLRQKRYVKKKKKKKPVEAKVVCKGGNWMLVEAMHLKEPCLLRLRQ